MGEQRRILVTGATGKVGQVFIARLLADPAFEGTVLRALCHNRLIAPQDRLEVVKGSLSERDVVDRAMQGVTHVLHLATAKESPDLFIDVSIKGLFSLLENCRTNPTFRQFILLGGDNAVGHFVYPRELPVTEEQPHKPYQGVYALTKVMEEVMLEQYYIQYDLNGCCLRAPWIMEKDDFKYQLSFGEDVFGGPRWRDLVGAEQADAYLQAGAVPVMLDPDGQPVQRNFVHVDDLVSALLAAIDHPQARQHTFNICMDEPVDYRKLGNYLARTRGLPTVDVITEYHSTWLDNTKAKFRLGWRPVYDLEKMVEAAWNYERAEDDPRIVWYPG
ncbi:MAG: NAD(P)-dependent oxidoreductase [Anaerolineae bacterium]|nr:NAD(P)-dependent oxidoreductase [Anaerolineae bacterium]